MAIATYTLADYIQDLRIVTRETQDPNEIIARVGPLAERAALSREWLKPQHYECDSEQGHCSDVQPPIPSCPTGSRHRHAGHQRPAGHP